MVFVQPAEMPATKGNTTPASMSRTTTADV